MNGKDQIRNGVDSIIAGVHRTAGRHLNEFLASKCAPDMLTLKLFPNTKEITESMGAYNAVRRVLRWDLSDRTISCFVVGDGCTPRTGALFAFRSAWQVTSIDPALKGAWNKIDRLTVIPKRIEDAGPFNVDGDALIVAVHSHAELQPCLDRIRARGTLAVVALPCCVDLQIPGVAPSKVYDDLAVWSPKREVRVWANVLPSERVPSLPPVSAVGDL